MTNSLGDRMKQYERAYQTTLPPRTPVIIRLDGKAFHTLTKNMEKPFCNEFQNAMNDTALALCRGIQGAVLAYTQSDEISVLVHYYKKFESEPWFRNQVQKVVSVSASIATSTFGQHYPGALFDSRVFAIPESDVVNYFIWRQQDFQRNSIQMVARSMFSAKECFKKNRTELKGMCREKGVVWDDLPTHQKLGQCVHQGPMTWTSTISNLTITVPHDMSSLRWRLDQEAPEFTREREYIGSRMNLLEG